MVNREGWDKMSSNIRTIAIQRVMAMQKRKNLLKALILLSPFLIIFSIFTLAPIFQGITLSLYRTLPFGDVYVGLDNYVRLFNDGIFSLAFRNTLIYGAFIALAMIIALLLALFINSTMLQPPSLRKTLQSVILIPMVISWVSLGMAWNWTLSIPITNGWKNPLASADTAIWVVSSLILWGYLGYNTILMLASLRTIPRDYYEAALIDGATGWQVFRYVTLPLMRPMITFMVVTGFIGAFQIFDPIATLTSGGPGWSTTSLVWYLQRQMSYGLAYGYAATIGIVVMIVVFIFSIIQYRLIYKRFA